MEKQDEKIRRIPMRSFIFKKKSKFKEVLYIQIRDTVRWKELLQSNLPEKWNIPKPEAIISITGVCHQFNIKDKLNLKRDLIKAVISTGSWIVTCGTESGAVRFIEDAVNEHIVLKDCHIPIIGILSQRIHDEFKKISESEKTFERWNENERKWVKLPSKSTLEALDPNHTQFIFTEDSKRKQTGSTATSECREAFENFLSNISTKDRDVESIIKPDKTDTQKILPVVLVLIEGGIDALRTVWSVLNNKNHVIVIKGSGGAANFLASRCRASRESNGDTSDTDITKLMKECFEDDSIIILKEIRRLSKLCLEKDKEEKSRSGFNLITIYSVDDKTARVDEYIQNAMFDIYKVFYANEMKRITKKSAKEKHCETVIKKQLKLVKQWKRCDIAEKEIFISKNRNELSALQTTINKKIMTELRKKMEQLLTYVDNTFELERDLGLMSMKKQFATCILQFDEVKTNNVKGLSASLEKIGKYLDDYLTESVDDDDKKKFEKKRNAILHWTFGTQKMVKLHKSMEEILRDIRKKCPKDFKQDELDELIKNFGEGIPKVYRGKPSYVKSLSESLQNIKQCLQQKSKRVKPHQKEEYTDVETKFREIRNTILDVSSRDGVSDLLEESLTANRTDLVKLIIDRIEDMQSFVLLYIPLIYQKSIWKSEEVLAIQLIEQQWKKHSAEDKNIVKITNKILVSVDNFIKDLLGDTHFDLYKLATDDKEKDNKNSEEIQLAYVEYPFHHLFVWAVLVNWKEMAMIFWKHDTDKTCSALFACAVLNELAEKAYYSNHMDLCIVLRENASDFETLACKVMTEMYRKERETALKTLVTNVDRYNSTPLAIAYSQNLRKFMAITASQAKLNSIWRGDIALYTPSWRIGMAVFFPMLIIQNIGFITIEKKNVTSKQIEPAEIRSEIINKKSYRLDRFDGKKNKENQDKKPEDRKMNSFLWIVYCVYLFYRAPIVKFFFYMIIYLAFIVIFASFVLTDLHPLSECSPSVLEIVTWIWTLSLAIEEARQMLQTNTGSFAKNIKLWAKNVWNIFDVVMYLLFLVSVMLRCLLSLNFFYFARLTYAITLSMFILRSMHFFFVTRSIGPKVVMIGRMLQDLAFFIALFALFVFSFGIMYQAVLFPNSVLSTWELFKNLVYLPYWQMYGELNIERIEGTEPSECTNDPLLYTNGTMARCAKTNQFNSPLLAVYLILTNILLVNILIAVFSITFQKVQDNSEMIWKFHRYALVYEYYDRPMFPIPIVIHLCRIVLFCIDKKCGCSYESAFLLKVDSKEIKKLHIVENNALEIIENGPYRAGSTYVARNMMTDERDINTDTESTPTQHDIENLKEYLKEEMQRFRESVILEIRKLEQPKPILVLDFPPQ